MVLWPAPDRAECSQRWQLAEVGVVGEVLGSGPDRALLPAVAVQPRAGRLQAVFEDVECVSGALELPAERTRLQAQAAMLCLRFGVPTVGDWAVASVIGVGG
ncbi:MAG: hypothetical protein M3065_21180 [Actinomycetota bacterium]|nr:hypothetical protein [Actinomycetota bacterium]